MEIVGLLVFYLVATLIASLACGFGARAIMRGKGRSGAAGFCLGFFLGLLGVLIAALMSTTPEYEAWKMQRQMQLMGLHHGGAMPAIAMMPPVPYAFPRTKRPLLAAGVLATIALAGFVVLAFNYRNYQYQYFDNDDLRWLYVGAFALCIPALVLRRTVVLSVVVGGAAMLVGAEADVTTGSWEGYVAVGLQLLAITAAIMVIAYRGLRPASLPSWWRLVVVVAGAIGVLSLLFAGNWTDTLSQRGVGLVLAMAGLMRTTREGIALAAGWGAFALLSGMVSNHAYGTLYEAEGFSAAGLLAVAIFAVGAAVAFLRPEGDSGAAALAKELGGLAGSFGTPVAGPGVGGDATFGSAVANPPRWMPDPLGHHELRYWDGNAWSRHVSDGGVATVDDGSRPLR